jgi:hypothetical protein
MAALTEATEFYHFPWHQMAGNTDAAHAEATRKNFRELFGRGYVFNM